MRTSTVRTVLSALITVAMLTPAIAYAKPSRMLRYARQEGYETDSFSEALVDPQILAESRTPSGWEVLSPLTPEYDYLGTVGMSQPLYTLDMLAIDASDLEDSDVFGFDASTLTFAVHGQGYGWTGWHRSGETAGRNGRRIEAVRLRLDTKTWLGRTHDVWYRAHCQSYGWLGWAKNGQVAGTTGRSKRLEALQVVLMPKRQKAPARLDGIVSKRSAPSV